MQTNLVALLLSAVCLQTAAASTAEFSPAVTRLPYPPDTYDLRFTAWSGDIQFNSHSPLKSLAAFYLREMADRGWRLDESEVEVDDDSIELLFTHDSAEVDLRLSQWSKEVRARLDCEELDFAGVDNPAKLAAAGLPVPPGVMFVHQNLTLPADAQPPKFDEDGATVVSPQGLQEAYDYYCDQVRKLGFRESRRPILTDTRRYTEFRKGADEVSVNVFTHAAGSRSVLEYESSRPALSKPPLAAVASLPIGNPAAAGGSTQAGGPTQAATAMAKTPVSVAANSGQAVVIHGGQKYTFKNVACFQTKDRGGFATEVVFASKPVPLAKLQQLLSTEDDPSLWDLYDDFDGPDYLILQLGDYESFSFSVPGVGIGGKQPENYKNEMTIANGRVQGAWTVQPETILSRQLSITATIDAALLTPTTRITSMPTEVAAGPQPADASTAGHAEVPFPDSVDGHSREGSNYRKTYTAESTEPWPVVSKFYQRELPQQRWTQVSVSDGKLVYRGEGRELRAEIKPAGAGSSITIVTLDSAKAERDGFLPERGKARLVLGNAHTQAVSYQIGKTNYPLKPGQGGRDPKDALNYTVTPATYTIVIKIPGEADQTEKLTLEEGSTWGIITLPTGGYLPMRMY
ncbi:hypothetical protein Pla123a_40530 [Posidoniimonas polymericola]|uniref:Uncharacterized protein n=1 Tax=Posidoniimonas polymericola TaxID=2528002 RepID=A0A5C5YCC4_9BACT|nr:hypothetical protein [Posidoniimonas polymericola]TWT72754.1 hypothetical protein Pla123a_40530 [Posidoniimonas polymericola]